MNNSRKVREVMLSVFIFTAVAAVIPAQTPAVPGTAPAPDQNDGQHDFDFELHGLAASRMLKSPAAGPVGKAGLLAFRALFFRALLGRRPWL
jgi:hypothetical protein